MWPKTGSERDIPLHWYHVVCLTHLSQMPPTHPFWCPHQPANEQQWQQERETEGDRKGKGRGRKRRTLERAVYFARLTENSQKCWDGIMLTNTDCDFLGGKQPALVNLEWLWTNVDPCPHHVKCHNRNAPQQFICILQIHIYVKWQVTSQNFSLSVTLGQFSTTLSVCSLVQH